jgi:uncharacterized protein
MKAITPHSIGLRLVLAAALSFPFAVATVAIPADLSAKPATSPPPLSSVRLLDGPFADALNANRSYLLAHDPDRLLAPFLREAGLEPKAKAYGNWESSGLDGHTAGHYLSALSTMIAAGSDTPEGEFPRRLKHMLSELERCQQAFGDGYLGGVPGSRALWKDIAAGRIEAHGFGLNGRWVPWYNLHKTFAGLRDAWLVAGHEEARAMFIELGDWCVRLVSNLTDEQMQDMLRSEHGGMNEVLADLYAITGNKDYLQAARRFNHQAVLDPLQRHEDRLTGLHANTQIPKVVGLARIAALADDAEAESGARFFWEIVTGKRTVAFGGNSVSEHFNDPRNFRGMLEHREGPETCNTYNMLRLTEQLFRLDPRAAYADYYERALYNHILPSIHTDVPGYVYFTPIRPAHYRVYSQPEQAFWCCVGSGMENPGLYGAFIYTQAEDDLHVNLFIPSELTAPHLGLKLRQETGFPDEPRTRLFMRLEQPATFTLHLRHPGWVATGEFTVRVNGEPLTVDSEPSSYAEVRREWRDGDRVELELPMRTTVERLPDGSHWVALLHGPIVLVAPAGTQDLVGLRADDTRMGHVAHGPLVPLDQVPVLVTDAAELPRHVRPDPTAGPLHFRLGEIVEPAAPGGLPLMPFFRLHDARYQMYWELSTRAQLASRREGLAAAARATEDRERHTLDAVAIGEQQPEVERGFAGAGTDTGLHQGRRWRHGRWFQYTLDTRGEQAVELAVTYWGGDRDRTFNITVNDVLLATERLTGARPGEFFEQRYPVPAAVLATAPGGRLTVRFSAQTGLAGGIFDLRLIRSEPSAAPQAVNPIIHADVPDMAMIRVGDTYYMSSTTMHMSPGLPIMKSKDLVNWELVSYAYDTLADNEALTLQSGRNAYGAGSWAPSLRHHKGTFYATTFSSTTGRTHIYRTRDIENGPWEENSFRPSLHDHSLFFDDDDRVYMLYGVGNLRLVELNQDLSGLKEGGFNEVVITNAHSVVTLNVGLPAEGSQLLKVNGKYYLFNITWPRGGMRTVVIHRADKLTGPWEGRLGLQDRGIAQGNIIDTPEGDWYAYLFRDYGAVGRIPYLVPVQWEDGWPELGVDGKVPDTLNLPASRGLSPGIVASDEFDRHPGEPALPLVWQWNHNPDNSLWSLTDRPGFLRLNTGRVDADFLSARNTLTQRTFGPESAATIAVDIGDIKDGDVAGLALLQRDYGLVGVKAEGGTNYVVMVNAPKSSPTEVERVPLNQGTVFLKAECDFKDRADRARFFYSLDGESWTAIGNELRMNYTLPHFMGYRFGLFNYATKETGGYADFHFLHISDHLAADE